MKFKTLERDIGLARTKWLWPHEDEKLLAVLEHVADIPQWLVECRDYGVAIQAGGACGVWPYYLAQHFAEVYTFEPLPDNYECLKVNCDPENIGHFHAALSNTKKRVSISTDIRERKNYGAGYIVDDPGGVETMLIDDLHLQACGLICLDIEGAELDALKGAQLTIESYKPLIVIEDKPMPQLAHFERRVGDPGRWLEQFGYRLVNKVRWDSVYSC